MRAVWSSSASLILCDVCPRSRTSLSVAAALGKQLILTWGFRLELLLFTLLQIVMWVQRLGTTNPRASLREAVPGSWEKQPLPGCLGCDWGQALCVLCWMGPSWLCSYGQRIHSYSHLQMVPLTTGIGFETCRLGCWTLRAVLGFPHKPFPCLPVSWW